MAEIVFEGTALRGGYVVRDRFTVTGNTKAEVWREASRMEQARGMEPGSLMAVGLHNSRADWEAVFGPSDDPRHVFADDVSGAADPVKPGGDRFVLRRLTERLRRVLFDNTGDPQA